MNKFRLIYILGGATLACAALALWHYTPGRPAGLTSIRLVLEAHGVLQHPFALSASRIEAIRSIPAGSHGHMDFIEQKLVVECKGNQFLLQKGDLTGKRWQTDLYDGADLFHTEERAGSAGGIIRIGDSGAVGPKFTVATFGLVHVLDSLAAPGAEVTFSRRTQAGEDEFRVLTPQGDWTFCTDTRHTIVKIRIGEAVIDYSDYTSIDGVFLPFSERIWKRGELVYKFSFKSVELNSVFPDEYFTISALKR